MSKDKNFVITSEARIEPPLTKQELASAFLAESELDECITETKYLMIHDYKLPTASEKVQKAFLSVIDLKYIGSAVKTTSQPVFRWTKAVKKIKKKYGLTRLLLGGSQSNINGFTVSSFIALEPKEHRAKFINLLRDFKQKFPKHHAKWASCVHTIQCDPEDSSLFEAKKEEIEG